MLQQWDERASYIGRQNNFSLRDQQDDPPQSSQCKSQAMPGASDSLKLASEGTAFETPQFWPLRAVRV